MSESPRDEVPAEPRVVLDPAVQQLVSASANPPYLHQLGPEDGRLALLEAQNADLDDPRTESHFHAAAVGPSGLTGFWTVRPANVPGPLPAVLYVHGGRWMFGDAQTHARLIRNLVLATGACFVIPEYSRTPEARYPVAVEEIYALLLWVVDQSAALDVRPTQLAIAGDCVGATMATAIAMMTKDRGGPRLCAQLLFYPFTDPARRGASHQAYASGFLLTDAEVDWYWTQYADESSFAEPLAAPAHATRRDLSGLPPALVVTAEADPVRDDGEDYARLLCIAGVEATAVRYLGTVHDFVSLRALQDTTATRTAVAQGADFLRRHLVTPPHRR